MKPITIKSRYQVEFENLFLDILKELNNDARILQMLKRVTQLKKLKKIKFEGDLEDIYQIEFKWVKTELKNRGIIKSERRGPYTYWSII